MTTATPPGVSRQVAEFETISRLIAALLNEGYVEAKITSQSTPTGNTKGALLRNLAPDSSAVGGVWIALHSADAYTSIEKGSHIFHPADFRMPVLRYSDLAQAEEADSLAEDASLETVVELLSADDREANWGQVLAELQNSAANQGTRTTCIQTELLVWASSLASKSAAWFSQSVNQRRPDLSSSALQWEQALVTGHPSHPVSFE
jgi:hypothetical protein